MAARRIWTGLILIATIGVALLLTPVTAGASGESVGSCIVDAVRDAEQLDLTEEQIEERAAEAIELCIQAPNPILPDASEVILGGAAFLVLTLCIGALVVWLVRGRPRPSTRSTDD